MTATIPSRMQSFRRRLVRHLVNNDDNNDVMVHKYSSSSSSSGVVMNIASTLSSPTTTKAALPATKRLSSREPYHNGALEQEPDTDASTTDGVVGASGDNNSNNNKYQGRYEPDPVVSQSVILAIGLVVFVLAAIWPPLILLLAYCASKLVPYSFRVNDDASTRRQLFAEFAQQDDLPEEFKTVPPHIQLRESYWVNAR